MGFIKKRLIWFVIFLVAFLVVVGAFVFKFYIEPNAKQNSVANSDANEVTQPILEQNLVDDLDKDEKEETTIKQSIDGDCSESGSNVKWNFDFKTGKLTIFGEGKIPNYDDLGSFAPWIDYIDKIKFVEISKGITFIPEFSFYDYSQLTKVSIASTVAKIEENVFIGCTKLTSIDVDDKNEKYSSIDGVLFNKEKTTIIKCPKGKSGTYSIPDSVNVIGVQAFYGCDILEQIDIPDSVETIKGLAFVECSQLKEIFLPSSFKTFEDDVFLDCTKLTSIDVDEKNKEYSSDGGVLFNKEKTTIIRYPQGRKGAYQIPGSVDTIGVEAFLYCDGLTQINILSSVEDIQEVAFFGCSALTTIDIPASVTNIGASVFSCCEMLSEIRVDEKNDNYSSVDGVLFNKSNTELIKCPENKQGEYDVPGSVKNIVEKAFYNCKNLTSVKIPNSVRKIKYGTFYGCESLKEVELSNELTGIGGYAFYDCYKLQKINIPQSVTSIGDYSFAYCESLEEITIPESVKKINLFSFEDCSSLKKITILNPKCKIADDALICDSAVIYGHKNSTAESYAKKHKMSFKLL